jgi:hypothetical protein
MSMGPVVQKQQILNIPTHSALPMRVILHIHAHMNTIIMLPDEIKRWGAKLQQNRFILVTFPRGCRKSVPSLDQISVTGTKTKAYEEPAPLDSKLRYIWGLVRCHVPQ